MKLGELAHLRAGDKGDVSQISVIAYDPTDYELLCREVTVDRVCRHLAQLTPSKAERYELPGLGALNFVLYGALDGGVTRSLSLDAHGKTLSAQLLDLDIDTTGRGEIA
jgi:hypothetical protein